MNKELGDAVSRIADSLSPLGAVARIVAEGCAARLEMRRLTLEGKQIEAEQLERTARIDNRQANVTEILQTMRREVAKGERNAKKYRDCFTNLQRDYLRPGATTMEKEMSASLMRDMADILSGSHTRDGGVLTGHIHEVLNGAGALDPRQSSSRQGAPKQRSAGRRAGTASAVAERS